jgi:hypothetical protein
MAATVVVLAATPTWIVVRDRHEEARLPPETLGVYVGFDRGDRFARMERALDTTIHWVVTMLDMTSRRR